MKVNFLFPLLVIFVVFFVSRSARAQAVKDSVWIQTNEGCKVHNPHPIKNETITWSGECVNGYASGVGTLIWYRNGKPGQEYTGEMKRGIPNGKGRYAYEYGTVREGIFVNGDLHGMGTRINKYKDTVLDIYTGEFRRDVPSGQGQRIDFYTDGDTMTIATGEFSEGVLHGKGIMTEPDGDYVTIFDGEFKQGKGHGHAEIYEYYRKDLMMHYSGEFRNRGRNGYGESVSGSNRYVGEWKENQREGKGKLYFDTLLIYEGEWHHDKFHGKGTRYYFDGSYYVGEFKGNLRYGIGIQRWKDGSTYIGEFEDDLYSGQGYFVKEEKVIACGRWVIGSLATPMELKGVKNFLAARYKTRIVELGINPK